MRKILLILPYIVLGAANAVILMIGRRYGDSNRALWTVITEIN